RPDIDQRWELRRRAGQVLAVTDAALAQVNSGSVRTFSSKFRDLADRRIVVGVDIDDARLEIDSRAAPLRAPFKARLHQGLSSHVDGEIRSALRAAKLILCPLVRFRSEVGQHVFRHRLPRIRSWLGRKGLLRRRYFA